MPQVTATAHGSAAHGVLVWTERVLIGCGVLLLAWAAFLVADQWIAQRLAREALKTVSPVATRATDGTRRPVVIVHGAPIAELSIPRLRLSAIVLHGSDAKTLRRGPGHIEQTALPGEPGNVAIAGHRDTFFRPMRNLRVGDDVFLETTEGRFEYRVSSLRVVAANDMTVLATTRAPTLTLITCYPFWVAGPAPDRFVAQAVEVSRPAAALALIQVSNSVAVLEVRSSPDAPPTVATATTAPASRRAFAAQDVRTQSVRLPSADLQIRAAIERFRGNYNGRLARRGATAERPLVFEECAIAFGGTGARATCIGPAATDVDAARGWTFEFRQSSGLWEMQSVEPN